MKAAIFSIGTEILFGEIVNTNSVYLSKMLNLLGIDVLYHHTVGDNPERLKNLLSESFEKVDLIITTGGLGPTQDDLTKEIITDYFNLESELNQEAMDIIERNYKRRGETMPVSNIKQAILPAGAEVFLNYNGTAPGFAIECGGKFAMAFPGPPHEMIPLFEKYGLSYLEDKCSGKLYYKTIRTFNIGESTLEEKLLPLIDAQTDPTIATYASEGESQVRIASKRASEVEARNAVDDMLDRVLDLVGEYVYSTEGKEYHDVVAEKLIAENISISVAESCTGGLFAKTLTDHPGISSVFDRSYITYSDNSKIEELNVNPDTIRKFTAVSRETAREMAFGLFQRTNSRLCIAVTGYADSVDICDDAGTNLSGLIYIAMLLDGAVYERKIDNYFKNRSSNRNCAVLNMLDLIYKHI